MNDIRKNSINRFLKKRRTSRNFSLLEIMVALTLFVMAAGAIGWKMAGWIEKRRFQVDLEQFQSRLRTIHRMAINMQADWAGTLKKEGKKWSFQATCLDPPGSKTFQPLKLHGMEVLLNGKKEETIPFVFFSSGAIDPSGSLLFKCLKDGKTVSWTLPALFGKKKGMECAS